MLIRIWLDFFSKRWYFILGIFGRRGYLGILIVYFDEIGWLGKEENI